MNEYNTNTYTIRIPPSTIEYNINMHTIGIPPIHEWIKHSSSPITPPNPQPHIRLYAYSNIRAQCTFKLTCLMHISRSNYTCTVYTKIYIHTHTRVRTYVLNARPSPHVSCTYHKEITSVDSKLTHTEFKWIFSTKIWMPGILSAQTWNLFIYCSISSPMQNHLWLWDEKGSAITRH